MGWKPWSGTSSRKSRFRHLIPQEPLQVTIIDRPEATGCQIRLQATRWGFTPRITVGLDSSPSLQGGILINVDPVNSWSPLDRTMLTIATSNLNRIARSQPEITRLQAGRYQLDLQRLIRDRLLDSSAPVRWDARLERIDGRSSDIRVSFVSNLEEGQ
jgi:hypothetical protein